VNPLLPLAAGFLMVLFRTTSLMMVAPLFGTKTVPARLRLSLAVAVSITAFVAAGMPEFAAWDRTGTLVVAAFGESILGLSAGLAARFTIDAVTAAGSAVSLSMGIGFSAMIDPLHGTESSAVAELLSMLTLGIAVAAGLHREAIAWLCRSVVAHPPGTPIVLPEIATRVIEAALESAALSVRLAFPIMTAVIFGHLALGLLGRTVPQLNLSNIGFSVAILAGGGALYLLAPSLAAYAAQTARAAFAAG
jgi:flagellar biosynthetic protein FliR